MRPRLAMLRLPVLSLTLLLGQSFSTFAKDGRHETGIGYRPFSPDLPTGTKCLIEVKRLRPTQFAVGMEEVRRRFGHVLQMKAAKQERYLREREVPVVVGPGGEPYVIDHHHLARILWDSGLRTTVYANVRANWRGLSATAFWKRMQDNGWAYPYDAAGRGPRPYAELPRTVGELRDDPFRSLAWIVREKGGYEKTDVPFAEFRWANFFRTKISAGLIARDLELAVQMALGLAASPEAGNLPGYLHGRPIR
jgi:hypothetical protein